MLCCNPSSKTLGKYTLEPRLKWGWVAGNRECYGSSYLTNGGYAYDADYSTYATTDNYNSDPCTGALVITYNMSPNNDYSQTIWSVKYGADTVIHRNFTIGDQCGTNHSTNNLTLMVEMFAAESASTCYGYSSGTDNVIAFRCWNGTAYYTLNWTRFTYSNDPKLYEEALYHYNTTSYPNNTWIEFGTVDGVRDWNNTQYFTTTETVSLNSTELSTLNTYINATCTIDSSGYCNVPVTIYSNKGGYLTLDNINVNYNVSFNPFVMNASIIGSYLNITSGFVNLPIKFSSDTAGILEVSDLKYDYVGGNKSYWIRAHTADYATNTTYNLTYYYSDWDYALPSNIQYLEFIPNSPTSKNVSPYGQRDNSNPIINITTTNYGGLMNLSIYLNESQNNSCVNLSYAFKNITGKIALINQTYQNLTNNTVGYFGNVPLYLYADYGCSYNTWALWYPEIFFRGCCKDCDICSAELS